MNNPLSFKLSFSRRGLILSHGKKSGLKLSNEMTASELRKSSMRLRWAGVFLLSFLFWAPFWASYSLTERSSLARGSESCNWENRLCPSSIRYVISVMNTHAAR